MEENTNVRAENTEVAKEKQSVSEMYVITAYCSCVSCCGKSDGITASGVKAVEGITVAADKSIPFGTKIYIDGIGERIVQDRGGAINENHIDLFFSDHQSALNFGRQTREVFIIE